MTKKEKWYDPLVEFITNFPSNIALSFKRNGNSVTSDDRKPNYVPYKVGEYWPKRKPDSFLDRIMDW